MKRRFLRRTAAGTVLALSALGAGSAAAATPATSSASTSVVHATPSSTLAAPTARVTRAVTSRPARDEELTDVLQTLVDDGALSSEERDAIAADVARATKPSGDDGTVLADADQRLFDLDAAARVIGTDAASLAAALSQDGATLADVAQRHGVTVGALVTGLTAAAAEHLDVAAAQGLIEEREAEERRAALSVVIADAVQAEYPDPLRGSTTDTV